MLAQAPATVCCHTGRSSCDVAGDVVLNTSSTDSRQASQVGRTNVHSVGVIVAISVWFGKGRLAQNPASGSAFLFGIVMPGVLRHQIGLYAKITVMPLDSRSFAWYLSQHAPYHYAWCCWLHAHDCPSRGCCQQDNI